MPLNTFKVPLGKALLGKGFPSGAAFWRLPGWILEAPGLDFGRSRAGFWRLPGLHFGGSGAGFWSHREQQNGTKITLQEPAEQQNVSNSPSAGTPSAGTPSAGTPSAGTPSAGGPKIASFTQFPAPGGGGGGSGFFFGPFWGKKHPFWGLFCGQFLDTPFFGQKKTPPKASFWHLNCYFITFFAAPLHKPAAQPLLRSACRSRCCAALTPCRAARRSRRGDAAARSGAATPTTTGDCSGDRCAPGACHLSTAE